MLGLLRRLRQSALPTAGRELAFPASLTDTHAQVRTSTASDAPLNAVACLLLCPALPCHALSCCCRSDAGAPLTVADAQLMLPQPEWELIAQGANSRNFAIDLQGEPVSAPD